MTNKERIKQLYDKMTRSGITRDERVELTALEASVRVAAFEQAEADKVKAQVEQEMIEVHKFKLETAQMIAEADRQAAILAIRRTGYNVNGVTKFLANNAANDQMLESILNPGEELSPQWFASVLKQQPKIADRFVWERPVDPNQKKLQEETDRKTFSVVCRSYDVSENEANFKLLEDVLGAGFSAYAAAQAIRSNAVSLSPATAEELTTWDQENVEAHNQWLLTSDVRTLKKIVANEARANRQAQLQAQADYDLEQRTQQQQGRFEPLPDSYKGEPVTKQFFLKCSRETMQYFLKRYGSAQVDQRIRGAA